MTNETSRKSRLTSNSLLNSQKLLLTSDGLRALSNVSHINLMARKRGQPLVQLTPAQIATPHHRTVARPTAAKPAAAPPCPTHYPTTEGCYVVMATNLPCRHRRPRPRQRHPVPPTAAFGPIMPPSACRDAPSPAVFP